jgi:hypothetical protein
MIYDEFGQPMRMVRDLYDAERLIKTYKGWRYCFMDVEPPPVLKEEEVLF